MNLSTQEIKRGKLEFEIEELEQQLNSLLEERENLFNSLESKTVNNVDDYKDFDAKIEEIDRKIESTRQELKTLNETSISNKNKTEKNKKSFKTQEIVDGKNFVGLQKKVKENAVQDSVDKELKKERREFEKVNEYKVEKEKAREIDNDEITKKARTLSRTERERAVKKNKLINAQKKLRSKQKSRAKDKHIFTLRGADMELESPYYVELINLISSIQQQMATPRYKNYKNRCTSYLMDKRSLETELLNREIIKDIVETVGNDLNCVDLGEDAVEYIGYKNDELIADLQARLKLIKSTPLLKYAESFLEDLRKAIKLKKLMEYNGKENVTYEHTDDTFDEMETSFEKSEQLETVEKYTDEENEIRTYEYIDKTFDEMQLSFEELKLLETVMALKKSSLLYFAVENAYIENLYQIQNLKSELERTQTQRNMLHSSLKDFGIASEEDYLRYKESVQIMNDEISRLHTEIDSLINSSVAQYMDNTISEELRILELRRNFENDDARTLSLKNNWKD